MSDDAVDQRLTSGSALTRVQALVGMKRYPEALQCAAENLTNNPEDSYAHGLMADIQFMMDDHEAAFQSAGRALQLDPTNDRALTRLAWCHLEFNAPGEALELARAAIKIDPEDSYNLYLLAVTEMRNGHAHAALDAARRGIEIDPEDADLHALLGSLIFEIEKPKNAIPHYLEALKHNPESAHLHACLAEAYAATGDMPATIEALERAVRLDPQDPEIRQRLFSIMHHHLLDVPDKQREKTLQQLDPGIAMFYQSALGDGGYTNKLRLASVVMLWITGLLGLVLVMALVTGEDIGALSLLMLIGAVVYLLLRLWQWWSNWRLQKKILRSQ